MTQPQDWRAWLERLQADGKLPTAGQTLEAMRSALRKGLDVLEGPPPEIADVRGLSVFGAEGPLPARLYTPYAAGVAPGPGLLFLHGGGFVLCDLDTHDRLCRRLVAASHVRVLSVHYRLAPKHRFPAAWEDAVAAFDWAAGAGAEEIGFDPARIAVGGDSAGGNLAACIAQARRRGGERPAPAFQLLIYPVMQLAETNAKRRKLLEGHAVATAILDGMKTNYLGPDQDPTDPRASPLFEEDLAGLCPAHVITTGLDPLRHEGRAYVDRLAAAGVQVTHTDYPTVPHGFLQLTAVLDLARTACERAGAELRAGLSMAPRTPQDAGV